MPGPTVSIGLPVYNGERFLAQSIESLLGQDYGDFELIVADNGSEDGTEDICRGYARADRRVAYHRSPTNRGLAWNFNRLVPLADGEYFKWAAADDEYAPAYLRRTLDALTSQPGAVLAHSRTVDIDESGEVTREVVDDLDTQGPTAHQRFAELTGWGHSCVQVFGLTRTAVLRRTGLLGAYSRSDRVLLAELALHGRLVEVDEVLFRRREFPGRVTRSYDMRQRYAVYRGRPVTGAVYPTWRLLGGFTGALVRAPLPAAERLRCGPALAGFAYSQRGRLRRDLVQALPARAA